MMELVKAALMITGFVLGMMLIIEYLNVLTAGKWQERLAGHVWGQYVLAALLGVLPGCLGAFTAVAMYTHGLLTLGAVVTAMIASSGDEAFVMLALIPRPALLLMGIVFGVGLGVGVLVDVLGGRRRTRHPAPCFELHGENRQGFFSPGRFARNGKTAPLCGERSPLRWGSFWREYWQDNWGLPAGIGFASRWLS
jgi:hypothetical protein